MRQNFAGNVLKIAAKDPIILGPYHIWGDPIATELLCLVFAILSTRYSGKPSMIKGPSLERTRGLFRVIVRLMK